MFQSCSAGRLVVGQSFYGQSLLGLCAVVILATGFTGCITPNELPSVDVTQNIQYDDIPVPLGFNYDSDLSWAYLKFESGPTAMRSCEFVYWGDRPLKEVANWYLEQMRLEGWQHERTDEHDDICLHFGKNHESAEILLERTVNQTREGFVTRLTTRIGVR